MDQIKVGRFISELRRDRELTQEQLGELIGVTNKTVSRWETGTYMPPIEALELLSKEFDVTINEIIAGERLTTEQDFRTKAEKNIASAWEDSAFTLKERQEYFRRRWLKNHEFERGLHTIICVVLTVLGFRYDYYLLVIVVQLVNFIGQIISYNAMMSYVEKRAFEKPNREEMS